jgi:predicted dehydrogenase
MSSTTPFRIGIIGAGSMPRAHVYALRSIEGVEVTAICDPDPAQLEAAEPLGIPFGATDHHEVTARDDVDAVIVGSPDFFHAEQAVDALNAGKHVLCEKPMVTSIEECRQVVAAADASGKVFMIGQVCRFSPGFITGKQFVDEGQIGELFLVESEYAHDYTHIHGHGGWRIDPKRPREPFLGGACHAVDLIRWVGGQPTEAFAYSNRLALRDWPVDDCTVAVFRFESGVVGKVVCSVGCKRDYTMRSVFWGTKGTVICDNTSTHMTVYLDKMPQLDLPAGVVSDYHDAIVIPVGTQVKMTEMEDRAFVSVCLGDAPLALDAREGSRTVAACLAAIESAKTGQPVPVVSDF